MEIFIACIQKDIDKIKKLIKKDNNIIFLSDKNGNTVGHLCAIYKIDDILIKIVKKYPKLITYLNNEGKSLLHLVENYNTLNTIIDFTIDSNISEEFNIVPYDGKTLLINLLDKYQNNNKYLFIINKLLDNKMRLNIPSENPPLNYYMGNNPNFEVELLLLKAGADPNLKNKYGLNALIIAVLNNINVDMIKLLLDYGADINYSGPEDKFLPLTVSLKKGYYNITEALIEYNPDLSHQDNNMNTPLHYAIITGKELPKGVIKYLILNSNLNIQNINGQTPLHFIIISKKWDEYYGLIKNKEFDFTIIDKNNKTPISYMDGHNLIYIVNTLSNKILRNEIKRRCLSSNNTVNYKCIERLRSIIKSDLLENKKEYSIEIPEVVDTDYGIFGTNILYNVIYLIQILKKYRYAFIPFQYFIPEKCIDQIMKLNDFNLYRTKYGGMLHDIVGTYTEYFFEIAPSIIIWHSKNIQHYDRNLSIYIKKLLDSDNIRFIIIKLTIISLKNMNHANIILYDKKTNVIERFEPYGSINYYIKDIEYLDSYLYDIFQDCIDPNIIYRNPEDYMGKGKLQLISSESDIENKKLGDPNGFCLAWCYWFLELKLKNPDYDTEELIKDTLSKIISEDNISSSIEENNVINHIRKYGKRLDLLKNDFLINIGFKKNELYNIGYSTDKLELLFNSVSKEFNEMISNRIK